ncbi:MAG TPA: hypothetical protein VIL26_01600 [Clostridia bacterium]
MKKKIFVVFIAFIMMFGALAGCGGRYPSIDVNETPDNKYAVTSNGGMAVQWGDFIYFINGYKAIADTTGKNNVWGDVVKGGIYYAKLTEGSQKEVTDYYGTYTTYDNSDNEFNDEFSGFITEKRTYEDENDEEQEIDQIVVKPVVSKLVTNGGYINGGIYIIDDYIYYTSPTTLKDKKGNIQYNLVDFYRTRVDGKQTQFLYRSKDTSAKPVYGYYKFGDSVYVVVYEASQKKIYSVRVTSKKVYKETVLAEDVTSAILPQKDVYYPGMSQDMPEDYIYYTREIDKKYDTEETSGNIVERVRPNGNERNKILTKTTYTLDKVSQGYLFYFTQDSVNKTYHAQSFVGYSSENYEPNPIEVFSEKVNDAPDAVFGIVYNRSTEDFVALAVTGSATNRYSYGKSTYSTLLSIKTKLLKVVDNDAYYLEYTSSDSNSDSSSDVTTGKLYKINYFTGEYKAITHYNIKIDFLGIDVAGGYVFYLSSYNEIAESIENDNKEMVPMLAKTSEYLRLQNLKASNNKEWDLGKLDKKDYPDPDEE